MEDVNGGKRINRLLWSRREKWRETYVGGKRGHHDKRVRGLAEQHDESAKDVEGVC